MTRAIRHPLGQCIQSINRNHERPFGDHVDRRSKSSWGGREWRAVERVDHLIRIGLAEEAQRDVPVVGVDEAHPALVLAMQGAELGNHLLRWPHGDEQACHPASQPPR